MNNQAATGLSIAGFVVLILSVFIPLYGLYIGLLALGLVAIGGFLGERIFTVLTVVVSAVKVWFLSPSFALMTGSSNDDAMMVQAMAIGAHAVPLIAMFIGAQRGPRDAESTSNEAGMPRGK